MRTGGRAAESCSSNQLLLLVRWSAGNRWYVSGGLGIPADPPESTESPFVQMAVGLSCCSLVGWLIVSGCRRWLQNVKSCEKWSPPPFDVPVVIVVVVAVIAVVAILLLTAGAASRIPFGGQATLGINFSLACARYRRHSRGSYRSVRPGGINP